MQQHEPEDTIAPLIKTLKATLYQRNPIPHIPLLSYKQLNHRIPSMASESANPAETGGFMTVQVLTAKVSVVDIALSIL